MAGIKKETTRQVQVHLYANKTAQLFFKDTKPNVIHVRNNYSLQPVYLSDKSDVSTTNYLINIIGGGTRKLLWITGLKEIYLYSAVECDVIVTTAESDEIFSNELDETQTTVIVNSTTTSSVIITDLPPLKAGTNKIGIVELDSTKALPAGTNKLGSMDITSLPALPAGSNNIGKVDVNSLPTGTNNIGKVDIASALPVGSNKIGKMDIDLNTSPLLQPATTPAIFNVTCTNANQEYSQALPANTKKISLSIQSWNSTTVVSIYYTSGAVAVQKILGYQSYEEDKILLANNTIYFKSSVAGEVVQITAWS